MKKHFPKIKKSLKNFLTDESGKITKKDALVLTAWATILSWLETATAGHTSTSGHLNQAAISCYAPWSTYDFTRTAHGSWIVNGHMSSTPNGWRVSGTNIWGFMSQWHANGASHASHGSHGNHWSGGWC